MVGILLVICTLLLAFIVGVVIFNVLGSKEEKYDHKIFLQMMNAKAAKENLEEKMAETIRSLKPGRTRKAIEEEFGPDLFKHLSRR